MIESPEMTGPMTRGNRVLSPDYMLTEHSENLWGYGRRLRFMLSAISEAFPDRPVGSIQVLDIGCGNGSCVAIPLAKVGFHGPSIESARKLAQGLQNFQFVCGVVEDLPLPLADVIILSEVLEHLNDPAALLRSVLQRLQPGGLVLVTVPNGHGEFEIDWKIYLF